MANRKNMSVSVEVINIKKHMKRDMVTGATVKSVSAMKKRKDNGLLEVPLKEVLNDFPEIREFLRDRSVGCEGCQLFHLANLKEVFSCYKLSEKEFNETLLNIRAKT